jgi:uncharacterized protein (TIGR03437 family)
LGLILETFKVIRFRSCRAGLLLATAFAAVCASPLARGQTTGGYTISTVAGTPGSGTGYTGDGAAATTAQFNGLFAIAVDSSGNLYICDQFNQRVRKVSGGTINTFAGDGTAGFFGDKGAATSAEVNLPSGVAVDSSGNLYIADRNNNVIRQVNTSGTITTVAGDNGSGAGYSGDNAAATSAQLNLPTAVTLDSAGNMYIADTVNNRIRKVTASSGFITTLAGSDLKGYQGDNGAATSALLNTPVGVAVDAAGNVYFSDSGNNVVRKITPNNVITTVAGTGIGGFSGDGGAAVNAQLHFPKGIALDAAGNLYIADYTNQRIRKVSANGIIQTVAGTGGIGNYGDGGPATQALLNFPCGVAVDKSGNVYIADTQNYLVRKLTPVAPSILSGGVVTASAFGAFGAASPGSWIEIYGSGLAIDSRSWARGDFSGNNAPTSLDGTSVTVGGQSAYVSYISPGQVNVQLPFSVATGSQPVVVTTPSGLSASYSLTVNALEPGLVAPPSFQVNGKQYVLATFTDGVTYVAPPNSVSGVTSRLAKPGDIIVLYGVGFGPVTPSVPAGQIVQQSNSLVTPVTFSFGGTPAATPSYAGLAPGEVGLYQFNVVVPTIAANSLTPLTFSIGSTNSTQTLYVAIGN